MARKREHGRQIVEFRPKNGLDQPAPHTSEAAERVVEIPATSAGPNANPRGLDFNDFWGRHLKESGS